MPKRIITLIMQKTRLDITASVDVMEWSETVSEEGSSSPYGPPKNLELSSSLLLQNSRSRASLPSRRGGVYKSVGWSLKAQSLT